MYTSIYSEIQLESESEKPKLPDNYLVEYRLSLPGKNSPVEVVSLPDFAEKQIEAFKASHERVSKFIEQYLEKKILIIDLTGDRGFRYKTEEIELIGPEFLKLINTCETGDAEVKKANHTGASIAYSLGLNYQNQANSLGVEIVHLYDAYVAKDNLSELNPQKSTTYNPTSFGRQEEILTSLDNIEPDNYDLIILSGSAIDMKDDLNPIHKKIKEELNTFSKKVKFAGVPVYGICFGHQFLSSEFMNLEVNWVDAAGQEIASVAVENHRPEEGLVEINLTEAGKQFPWLQLLGSLWLTEYHRQHVSPPQSPEGFEVLAGSSQSPVQIIRKTDGSILLTIQGHPEKSTLYNLHALLMEQPLNVRPAFPVDPKLILASREAIAYLVVDMLARHKDTNPENLNELHLTMKKNLDELLKS